MDIETGYVGIYVWKSLSSFVLSFNVGKYRKNPNKVTNPPKDWISKIVS